MSVPGNILPQDQEQYIETHAKQIAAESRERTEQDMAEQERIQKQIDKQNADAEAEYQKQLKESSSQSRSEEISRAYQDKVAALKKERDEKIAAIPYAGNRSKQREEQRRIANIYEKRINDAREKGRIQVGYAQFSETYPGKTIPQSALQTFKESKSFSLVGVYQKSVAAKEAKLEYDRQTSIKEARNAPRYTKEQTEIIQRGYTDTLTGSTPLGQGRAEQIKQTPNIVTGQQAVKTRPNMINVDTGQSIMNETKESSPITITRTETFRKDPTRPAGLDNPVLTQIITEEKPAVRASRGVPANANPSAFIASLSKQNVDAAGKPLGKKESVFVSGLGTVQSPSASIIALAEFQEQRKTTEPVPQTVLKGYLKERNLPIGFREKQIIYQISSSGIYRNYKEPSYAKGQKPTYTEKSGLYFDTETMIGSKQVAKNLGYNFTYGVNLEEISLGKNIPKNYLVSLKEDSLGGGKLDKNDPRRFLEASSTGKVKDKVLPQSERPLSNYGQRLEYGLKLIEEEQKRTAKFNDDDVGELYHIGLGIGKNTLTAGAFIESSFWQGEALARNGRVKTREINIPPTAGGIFMEGITSQKDPSLIYSNLREYEKTHGRGSTGGEVISLLLPIPGAKIKAPATLLKTASKVSEKIKIPQFKTYLSDKITLSRNSRVAKQIAESRADEGIYGIEKKQKKLFFIERGFEEERAKKNIENAVPQIKASTKTLNEPIETKIPKNQKIPPTGKPSDVPLSIVRFGEKGKTTITDFTEPKVFAKSPEKIIISSPDIDFVKQERSLKATQTAKGVFEITNPSKKTLMRVEEMQKSGYLSHVSTGRTVDYNLVKKDLPNKLPKSIEEMQEQTKQKTKGEVIKSKEQPKPKSIKEMLEIQKKLAKTPKEKTIFDVIENPQLTQVYETLGGLGKSKFVRDVTKNKEIITYGSKDLERKLESVGLGEKRTVGKAKTPYNYSQLNQNIGTAGSAGKAQSIKETFVEKTKNILSAPKLEKKIPIDYLQIRSSYVPRSREESNVKGSQYATEYVRVRYPDERENKLKINVIPSGITESIQRSNIRDETGQSTRNVLQGQQATRLDTSLVTKQKTETLQRQKIKLDTSLRTLRLRKFVAPRMIADVIPVSVLASGQPQILSQPQRLQLREKEIELLKYRYPERPREPETPRRRPFGILLPTERVKQLTRKESKSEKADFLGSTSETEISGIFKRTDITYGQKRINKLLSGDVRVVKGGKRGTKPRAKPFREGKQGDVFGFRYESKKKAKFGIF